MNKHPLLNSSLATLYIVLVSTVMYYGSNYAPQSDTLLAPIAMLSLLTLSAAVMGYLFVAGPILLYLDGKKKEGVALFMQTIAYFAGLTALAFALYIAF